MAITNEQLQNLGFFKTVVSSGHHKRVGKGLLTVYKAKIYYAGIFLRDIENTNIKDFKKWLESFIQSTKRKMNAKEAQV